MWLSNQFEFETPALNNHLRFSPKVFFGIFREIKECFRKKDGSNVNFVLMGDSRVRNLYEFFEFMVEGNFTPWEIKPHRSLNITYDDFKFNLTFLWAPQTETGNQEVKFQTR